MRGIGVAEVVEEVSAGHVVHEEVNFCFGLEGGAEGHEKGTFVSK